MSKVDDIRLKVKRAEQHLEYFKATVFGREGTIYPLHGVSIHYEPKREYVSITSNALHPTQQIEWGILIGDVVHQTRSALDHVVHAVATSKRSLTTKEIKNISFLICQNATDFGADWRVREGFFEAVLGPDVLTQIEDSQPYKTNRDELWMLKCLDDIDKHRTILVIENRVRVQGTAYSEDGILKHPFDIVKEPMGAETESFSLNWPHPRPPAAVNMDTVTREVVFTEPVGLCEGRNVFPLVRDLIRETLVTLERFDQFFPL